MRTVDIYANQKPIVTETINLDGITYGAELNDEDIIACLKQRAQVYQILEDGSKVRLTLQNMQKDLWDEAQKEKEEKEKLEKEYKEFKQKEKIYLSRIEQLEKDLADSDTEGMLQIRNERDKALADLALANERIAELEAIISTKDAKISELEASIRSLTDAVSAKDVEISSLNVTISQKETLLTTERETSASLSTQLSAATTELEVKVGELNQALANLENANNSLLEKDGFITQLETDLSDANTLVNSLNEQVSTLTTQKEELEDLITTLNGRIEDLENQQGESSGNAAELQQQIDVLNAEKLVLVEEKESLETRIALLEANTVKKLSESDIVLDMTGLVITKTDADGALTIDTDENLYDASYTGTHTVANYGNTSYISGTINSYGLVYAAIKVDSKAEGDDIYKVLVDGVESYRCYLANIDLDTANNNGVNVIESDITDSEGNVLEKISVTIISALTIE